MSSVSSIRRSSSSRSSNNSRRSASMNRNRSSNASNISRMKKTGGINTAQNVNKTKEAEKNTTDRMNYSRELQDEGKGINNSDKQEGKTDNIVNGLKSMNGGLKQTGGQNKDHTQKTESHNKNEPGKVNGQNKQEKTDGAKDPKDVKETKESRENKPDEKARENDQPGAAEDAGKQSESDKAGEEGKTGDKQLTPQQKQERKAQRLQQLRQDVDKLKKVVEHLEQNKGKMNQGQFRSMLNQAKCSVDDLSDKANNIDGDWSKNTQKAQRWDDLIGKWRQSSEGNCVAVATIKAAMHKWGNRVFDSMKQSEDGGYNLRMRDGTRMQLSPNELATARNMSRFKSDGTKDGDAARDYANVCYAAMAKRALWEGHEGSRTFARACHSLNNGENPAYPAKLLGVGDHLQRMNMRNTPNEEIAILWNNRHCIYSTYGNSDRWGHSTNYRNMGMYSGYAFR